MQPSSPDGEPRCDAPAPKVLSQNSNSNTDSSAYPSTGSDPSQGSVGLLTSAIMLGTMEEGMQSIIAEDELRRFEEQREKLHTGGQKPQYEGLGDV